MTLFTLLADIRRLTSFKIKLAVCFWTSVKPLCVCTPLGTPGNRVESRVVMAMLMSVRSDSLG